uniref:Uncharacterized protein n=1 Tax=Panagrolaimus davidi TaxID=227884 RepID=A0A914PDP0_9BILA
MEATEPRYDRTPFVVQYAPHAEDEEGMEEITEEHYVEEQEMEATHDQAHVESTENVVKATHNDEHQEAESSQTDEEINS